MEQKKELTPPTQDRQPFLSSFLRRFCGRRGLGIPWVLSLLLCVAILGTALAMGTPCFSACDDGGLIGIASGALVSNGDPSPYLIHTNILIGHLLANAFWCYRGFNWYTALQYLAMFLGMWAIVYRLLLPRARVMGIFISLLILLLFGVFYFLRPTFTITAAVAATGGAALLCPTSMRKGPMAWRQAVASVLLLTLGGLIRIHSFYLVAAFVIPLAFAGFFLRRRYIATTPFLVAFAVIFAAQTYNLFCYRSIDEFKTYMRIDRIRRRFHDYPYSSDPKKVIPACAKVGWSLNDYRLFAAWPSRC